MVKKPRTAPAVVTTSAQAPAPDAQAKIAQDPDGRPVAEPEGKKDGQPDIEPAAESISHKSQKIVINRNVDKTIDKKPVLPDTDPEKPPENRFYASEAGQRQGGPIFLSFLNSLSQ